MNKKNIIISVIVVVILLVAVSFIFSSPKEPGEYTALAECISDSGAKFYGTFWCSHCINQKKAFGDDAKLLPYIECSTADGKSQLQICTDNNITGYPTWVFSDGERQSGEIALAELARQTGCSLP
jgi:hypothetical protein